MANHRPAITQQQQSGGFFGNADHTVIYGGSFTSVGSAKGIEFLNTVCSELTLSIRGQEWFSDFAGARRCACISQLKASPRSSALSREHTTGRAAGAFRMDHWERCPHGVDCMAEWRCWSRKVCYMSIHGGDVHYTRHIGG